MAVTTNTTTTTQITVQAKEIDFASRFESNWQALIDILGIMNPVRKTPGTVLSASVAEVTLQSGDVAEGDEVPLSQATVTPKVFENLKLKKYRKRVTAEAVEKFGAAIASQKTDDAFISEITTEVLDSFYSFIQTGSLASTYDSFQMAVSMAIASVKDKFKKAHLTHDNIVVFVNTLDVGKYLGNGEITIQTRNGIDYFQDYLGARTVIVSSDIPEGTVIATPASNIVLYYIDPADDDLKEIGLVYTTSGNPTSLIGVHKEGVYGRVSGDTHAIVGMKLFAEYIDGIAVNTITA